MNFIKVAMLALLSSLPHLVLADGISEAMAKLDPGDIHLCTLQVEAASMATEMRLSGSTRSEAIGEVMAMDLGPSANAEHGKLLASGVIARANEIYDIDVSYLSIPLPEEEAEKRARLMGELVFNNCIELISETSRTE